MAPETEPSSSSQNSSEPRGLLYILLSAFAFLFGWSLSKLRAPIGQATSTVHSDNSTNDSTEDSRDYSTRRVGITKTDCPSSPPECRYPEKKLKRWWKRWKPWVFLLNLATFIAVVVYARINWKMWREMQQQTCIQRNAAMNAERAWVGLDGPPIVDIGLLEDRKRMGAAIHFTVKDYGKGPALSVMASAAIVPTETGNRHVVEDSLESTCNFMFVFVGLKPTRPVSSDEDAAKRQWGHVVFPNQPFSTGTLTTIDMSKMIGKEVYVVGCIVYRDQFSEPHWTKFCYNTGDFAKDVVKDASSFKHLYMCNANNYTDDVEKKTPPCPVMAVPE